MGSSWAPIFFYSFLIFVVCRFVFRMVLLVILCVLSCSCVLVVFAVSFVWMQGQTTGYRRSCGDEINGGGNEVLPLRLSIWPAEIIQVLCSTLSCGLGLVVGGFVSPNQTISIPL
jgi:hypothetical protein